MFCGQPRKGNDEPMNLRLTGVRACVFDAYGTLFDVYSAGQQAQNLLNEINLVTQSEIFTGSF